MTNEELALKVNDHEHEIGSFKHRMKAVDENQKALNSLATSVAVMVEKVDGIDAKVSAIEQKPGKRWDGIVDKLLWLVIGAAIAALFAQAGVAV